MAMKQPGQKTYKTMRGRQIDMEMLRKKNELVPAIGNAKVNARGDELGPGGKIVRKREDIVNDYYKSTQSVPTEAPAPKNKPEPEEEAKADTKTESKQEQKKTRSTSKAKAEQPKGVKPSESEAAEWDDDWEEDADGNFVKKGE